MLPTGPSTPAAPVGTGLPWQGWHGFVDGGVPLRQFPDWAPVLPPALGGGEADPLGEVDTNCVNDDHGDLDEYSLGLTTTSRDGPLVAAVARAAGSNIRTEGAAGPVLDRMDPLLHLPFTSAN